MDAEARRRVRSRAGGHCEYCRLHERHADLRHQVEHVIARQHGGGDEFDNLAYACARCNAFKGPNLSGIDPDTGCLERLFHPRLDIWTDHFAFRTFWVVGLTPIGRTTVYVLGMNEPQRLEIRSLLLSDDEL